MISTNELRAALAHTTFAAAANMLDAHDAGDGARRDRFARKVLARVDALSYDRTAVAEYRALRMVFTGIDAIRSGSEPASECAYNGLRSIAE